MFGVVVNILNFSQCYVSLRQTLRLADVLNIEYFKMSQPKGMESHAFINVHLVMTHVVCV